ncbi:MAG: M15 family metallopeptidase [Planctomycetaceae bacterium]
MRRTIARSLIALALVTLWTEPAASAQAYRSSVSRLPRAVKQVMRGSSWRPGCPVPLSDLRLVRVTYWGFDREAHPGKLVVHRWYADEVARLFGKLYEARFPIRRMELVDRYGADDTRSMKADNTSAFNCRYRNGVCCTWSMHAYGKAIDIDPVENPYVGPWGVSPPNGAKFADRSKRRKGMLYKKDRVWWAFHAIGWAWGGTWKGTKDYQHFSSNGR